MPGPMRLLACVFQHADDVHHLDACSSINELAPLAKGDEIKIISHPTFEELQQAVKEFKPRFLYISGHTSYEHNKTAGTVSTLQFKDGAQPSEAVAGACSGVEVVYVDAAGQDNIGAKLQAAGVLHAIVWPDSTAVPAVVAAQFSHTLFTSLLELKSTVHEAFALASHVAQAHCCMPTAPTPPPGMEGMPQPPPQPLQHQLPVLPSLFSPLKAQLPDNSSVPTPAIPGVDASAGLAASVQGWSDIRLLAPRAELRLLLTGNASLIDGSRLSFLGEALRALLVMEMRGLTLISSTPCAKTPANLPLGCAALRCEVRTTSGADVVAILGGQPSVLSDSALVEHALRMTLVADSLSLQFRLPPPTQIQMVARTSAAVAGGAPFVDAHVLTSVWAVHVLRNLSLMPSYKSLISLGVAAVGCTATIGVSPTDAQRLKCIVTGQGPSVHPLAPIQPPGSTGPTPPVPPPGSAAAAAAAPTPPVPPPPPPAGASAAPAAPAAPGPSSAAGSGGTGSSMPPPPPAAAAAAPVPPPPSANHDHGSSAATTAVPTSPPPPPPGA